MTVNDWMVLAILFAGLLISAAAGYAAAVWTIRTINIRRHDEH